MATWILSPRGETCCECQPNVCDDCSCPEATLVCRTASASKTKCGFVEFGTPSSPPKRYLVKTQAGGLTNTIAGGTGNEQIDSNAWSGAITYSRPACTTSDTRQVVVALTLGVDVGNCTGSKTETGTRGNADNVGSYGGGDSNGCYLLGTDCSNSSAAGLQGCCSSGTVASSTVMTFATTACSGYLGGTITGSDVTITLSVEYTTADLESDVDAALPSFSGSFSSGACAGAYYDISSNELTITKRKVEYKFTLPDLTGIECYSINWVERFTPESGSPSDTPKSYTWNGTDTETGVYSIAVPASQGTTTIEDVTFSCVCP